KGIYLSGMLERYKSKERSLKIKVIVTKIIYAFIFGILPIMPLLTYFQIVENLSVNPVSTEIIILIGSMFFTMYFILQFFNFFLMGLLESGIIMSGVIFRWFETLPISRDKLHKVTYLTIFRSFDIPIIVIMFGFPIVMLIGTQNIFVFFVSLGISILNIIFSFNLLLFLGGRLNRVLSFNVRSMKRSSIIRLFHILSYLIVILGSVYTIQWAFNSIEEIFQIMLDLENPSMINLILSFIPYPFNPSYLLSYSVALGQVSMEVWVNLLIGLGLFIMLTWWTHLKASKTVRKITDGKFANIPKKKLSALAVNEIHVRIKIRTPIKTYLRKDLSAATHDLKTLLSMMMPIILSCIFSFSFNIGNIGSAALLEGDFLFNWVGMLIFNPIISSMLVYGLLNIESSGKSVLASLPINPREQAKAKLILLLTLQTLAVLAPLIIYAATDKFFISFFAILTSLPITWIYLILTFELRVLFFGKHKDHYVIDEIHSENRIYKWVLITSILYILSFWIMSFLITYFTYQQLISLAIFLISLSIIGLRIEIFLFFNLAEATGKMTAADMFNPYQATLLAGKNTRFGSLLYQDAEFLLYSDPNATDHKFWTDVEGSWTDYPQEHTWTQSMRPSTPYTSVKKYFDTVEHNLNQAVYYCATVLNYVLNFAGYTECEDCGSGSGGQNPNPPEPDGQQDAVRDGLQLTLDQFEGLFYFNFMGLMATAISIALLNKVEILEELIPLY
ncbi:MAG: hypothetical protein ACW99L_15275, partial [Promethearchaeota archaeon]